MAYPLNPNPAYSYSPAYGGIPSVPSPISTAGEAITGNLGNLGGLYKLAGSVNAFNQAQAPLGLQANLPGYQGMIGQSSRNIAANLAGQVPQDVVNQIAQQAAERGTATGLGTNAPNSNAALLRALGLSSLGQTQLGEQQLTAAIGRTPQGPVFDPSKFFVTPDQEQQAQAAADLYKSAPIPSAAAAEARSQAGAGMRAGGGGVSMASQLPAGSPFKATTWGGAAPSAPDTSGLGMTYGGQTYYGGATPATATSNWNQWYGSLPSSTPTGTTGTGSFYAGSANPMWADEYGGYAEPTTPAPVSTYDPFMGLGSFAAGGTGTAPGASEPSTNVGDLLGTLTPEDLAGFM